MMKRRIVFLLFYQIIFSMNVCAAEYCSRNGEENNLIRISNLLSNPGKYESSVVEIVGIYVFAYPHSFIFSNVDDYVAVRDDLLNATGAIRLEMNRYRFRTSPSTSLVDAEFGPKAEGKIVRVKGKFYNRLSHGSSVQLFIDDIQDFAICRDK